MPSISLGRAKSNTHLQVQGQGTGASASRAATRIARLDAEALTKRPPLRTRATQSSASPGRGIQGEAPREEAVSRLRCSRLLYEEEGARPGRAARPSRAVEEAYPAGRLLPRGRSRVAAHQPLDPQTPRRQARDALAGPHRPDAEDRLGRPCRGRRGAPHPAG